MGEINLWYLNLIDKKLPPAAPLVTPWQVLNLGGRSEDIYWYNRDNRIILCHFDTKWQQDSVRLCYEKSRSYLWASISIPCGDAGGWWFPRLLQVPVVVALVLLLLATGDRVGDVPILSEADILENADNVSGKLGGVAGVFAGVQIGLKWPLWWQLGTVASWKNKLRAVSNCQCDAWRNCFACSLPHPATSTNWFIITCSLRFVPSIVLI